MEFRAALASAGAVLALAACTPMQWVKPDTSPEASSHDTIQCQQDAWREARSGWSYWPFGSMALYDPLGRRFFARPYGFWSSPFGDPFMEEARLAQFCMRNKGYALKPIEEKPARP